MFRPFHRALRRHAMRNALAGILSVSVLVPAVAQAVQPHVVNRAALDRESASDVYAYWTRERMRNAQPLPIPEGPPELAGPPAIEEPAVDPSLGTGGPGAPPLVEVPPSLDAPDGEGFGDELDEDEELNAAVGGTSSASDVQTPSSYGTDGCHFSSSRLNPRTIDARYPYRAVGKLFFTKPGFGDFECSGAVMRPRVVVTAGHCVHSGNGSISGWFTNFLFCPAYRGGPSSRFGCWAYSGVLVNDTWYDGGGTFPNAADYALMTVVDRVIGGVERRIGDVTGYFGYQTLSLTTNHVHMFGYPADFSGGERMHQVASGRCYSGGSNTERYGSDMRGGSSGGPWVMDFGIPASGQTVTNPNGPNVIVGVASYASVSTSPKYQGASIPDARFQSLLDSLCAFDTTPPANCF